MWTWLQANWPVVLSALWGLDQVLVSIIGKSTLLDSITSILKSLGAGPTVPPKP